MPIKPWKDLTIRDDYMFKLVMRNKRICRRMLEMILRVPIRDIRYLEEEKSISPRYDSKGIRLDVYAEGEDTVYEVEMQVRQVGTEELAKRTRYYQSVIDQDMLKTGYSYKRLKLTIIIFICPFDPFGQGRHLYTFRNLCKEDPSLEMGDGTAKVFLNTKGTMDDVPADVKAFCGYVNGIASEDGLVQEIEKEVQSLKYIEKEEVSYMTYAMKLEEAHEDGIRQGIEQGTDSTMMDCLKTAMRKLHLSAEEAMDMFDVPAGNRDKYAKMLQPAISRKQSMP